MTGMFAVELAMGFLVQLDLLERHQLTLGQRAAVLRDPGYECWTGRK
jgi:hypothetical protein